MKRLKNKLKIYHRGFTLIELMVVISIIGLLSSIVLVAVKDARDKAKAKAFRAEINQLINALELYKADNKKYPGEPTTTFEYGVITGLSGDITYAPIDVDLKNDLLSNKYISKLPIAPTKGSSYYYYYNPSVKCVGDSKLSNYYIFVSVQQPGFEDWPFYTANESLSTAFRCFSLK